MGFFKGAKDLKKLSDHHGGMPSVRGAFKDIGELADDRGEGDVLKHGIAAKGVAKGLAEPAPGHKFAMHIPMEVHPPGGEPYEVDYVFPTARMKAAMTVGMEVPIKIHPEDPTRIAVQWDAQQASIAAAGGDMAAISQGMQSTYGSASDAAYRQAKASAEAEDPTNKLKKLGEMKDAGLISEDEFNAKKAEILEKM